MLCVVHHRRIALNAGSEENYQSAAQGELYARVAHSARNAWIISKSFNGLLVEGAND
jgi:hypothetical protein